MCLESKSHKVLLREATALTASNQGCPASCVLGVFSVTKPSGAGLWGLFWCIWLKKNKTEAFPYCRTGFGLGFGPPGCTAAATLPCPRRPPFPSAPPLRVLVWFLLVQFLLHLRAARCWIGDAPGEAVGVSRGRGAELPHAQQPPRGRAGAAAPAGRSGAVPAAGERRASPGPAAPAVGGAAGAAVGAEPSAAPGAAAAMEPLRVLLAAALLPLLPREYPRDRLRRRKGRLPSSRDAKAELCPAGSRAGWDCEGSGAPKPCLPQLAGQLCHCLR